jgi:hypothetical protein
VLVAEHAGLDPLRVVDAVSTEVDKSNLKEEL